jgi:hypothetical protein
MQRKTATKKKPETITSSPLSRGILQRKCACGNQSAGGSECGECGKKKQLLQRRAIHLSEPGDRYEQEADRIADKVMRMPEPTTKHQVESEKEGVLQRKAIANSITPLQFSSIGLDRVSEVPPIINEVLNSPGQSLDTDTRTLMEPRFGHDFSGVRVHTGAVAEQSAREVNANAYTLGHNIVFGAGQLAPETHEGRRLIAHELTHTIQQERTNHNIQRQPKTPPKPINNPDRSITSPPCPGSLQTAHILAVYPATIFGVGHPKNTGGCPISIAGTDEQGRPIMPNLSLEPGKSKKWFYPPSGTVKIIVACFSNCSRTARLEYDTPNA